MFRHHAISHRYNKLIYFFQLSKPTILFVTFEVIVIKDDVYNYMCLDYFISGLNRLDLPFIDTSSLQTPEIKPVVYC